MESARNQPLETPGIDDKLSWKVQWKRMASLGWTDFTSVVSSTLGNWYSHNVPRLGASLAFYTLLSLAPLLVIVIAIAGAVFGREAAEGQLVWQIQGLTGRDGAEVVQALLRGARSPGAGTFASVIGLFALLYGATAVVSELRAALNTIWCVPVRQETALQSVLSVLKERTRAFAAVIGVGFLLLVSLTVSALLSAAGERYQGSLPVPAYVLGMINLVVSYIAITILFTLMYKLLPDLHLDWRDVIPGALVTALLFNAGKTLIGIYLGRAGFASTYGAAGSLVVVLFWVYYSAQIFFLGAEFTQVYAQRYGSRPCDRLGKEVKIVENIDRQPETPEEKPSGKLIQMP